MILLLAGIAWLVALAVGWQIGRWLHRLEHAGDPRTTPLETRDRIVFDFPTTKSARAETSRPSAASIPEWRADGTQD